MSSKKELEYCYVLKQGIGKEVKNYCKISEEDVDLAFRVVKSYMGQGRINGSETSVAVPG